jgi:glycosyltransferase involved in cell wall biosynthesis
MREQKPLISVVICTFNRAELVGDALKGLSRQTLEVGQYEVIVVDNNSSDQTKEVVDGFVEKNINFRYCREQKQGLSYARNRGIDEARGRYVGYIDDDCRVPEGWLVQAKKTIDEVGPTVFGGPFFPFYQTQKPRWYLDRYGAFEVTDHARALGQGEFVYGGNMFFEKQALVKIGRFDPNYGMSGHKLGYAEEIQLQKMLRDNIENYLAYYEPKLYVYHLVRAEKMLLRWIIRKRIVEGRQILEKELIGTGSLMSLPKFVYSNLTLVVRFMGGLTTEPMFRDRAKYPYYQNYFYERTSLHIKRITRLWEIYTMKKRKSINTCKENGVS